MLSHEPGAALCFAARSQQAMMSVLRQRTGTNACLLCISATLPSVDMLLDSSRKEPPHVCKCSLYPATWCSRGMSGSVLRFAVMLASSDALSQPSEWPSLPVLLTTIAVGVTPADQFLSLHSPASCSWKELFGPLPVVAILGSSRSRSDRDEDRLTHPTDLLTWTTFTEDVKAGLSENLPVRLALVLTPPVLLRVSHVEYLQAPAIRRSVHRLPVVPTCMLPCRACASALTSVSG